MSKKLSALIVVLLVVIGIQGWLLSEAKKHANVTGTTGDAPASTIITEQSDPAIVQNEISNQLARIDARLSALETAKPATTPTLKHEIVLGSPEALAADRKIAVLLPDRPISQQELFLYQSQLAQYPPSEQAQLSAALARAVNNGQLEISAKQ